MLASGVAFAACGESDNDNADNNATDNNVTDNNVEQTHTHSYGDWTITKQPTCTEKGERQKTCTCGDKVIEEIAATGHSYSTVWTTDETNHWHKATCEHTTEISGKAEHTYKNGVCSVCNVKEPTVTTAPSSSAMTQTQYNALVEYYTRPMIGEIEWKNDGDINELSDWNFAIDTYYYDDSSSNYVYGFGSALDCANKIGYEVGRRGDYNYYYEKDGKTYENDDESKDSIYELLVDCYTFGGGEIVCTAFYCTNYSDWKYDENTQTYSAEWKYQDYNYTAKFNLENGKIKDFYLTRSDESYLIKFSNYGTTKIELPKEEITLTADTDFDALVSDNVTESEWDNAFAESSFKNATIKTTIPYYGEVIIWNSQETTDAQYRYMNCVEGKSTENEYSFVMFVSAKDGQVDVYLLSEDGQFEKYEESNQDLLDEMYNSYKCACLNLSGLYSSFTYDETEKAYIYDGEGIMSNAVLDARQIYYTKVKVKIVNGKVAYIYSERFGYDETAEYFVYDYGTTEFEIPEIEESTED
jgi:hypothetical protein